MKRISRMFHALHCLNTVRDDLEDKTSHQTRERSGRSASRGEPDRRRGDYVQHRFAYIAKVSYSQLDFDYRVSNPRALGVENSDGIPLERKKVLPVNLIECFLLRNPCFGSADCI